jgi:purine-binding chemotaxis protein CheW
MKNDYNIAAILDGMRKEYWREVSAAPLAAGESLECVTLRLGGELFAFESTHAAQVIRLPKLVPVPRAGGVIAGVFNLRGEITAAIDIASLLGLEASSPPPYRRVIILKGRSFLTGLLVEEVLGVEQLPAGDFLPAPEEEREGFGGLVRGEFPAAGGAIRLLDIPKLLSHPALVVDSP